MKDAKEQLGQNKQPLVSLKFSDEGGKKFADLTAANVGRHIGIYLDGEMLTNPVVNEAITAAQPSLPDREHLKKPKIWLSFLEAAHCRSRCLSLK